MSECVTYRLHPVHNWFVKPKLKQKQQSKEELDQKHILFFKE